MRNLKILIDREILKPMALINDNLDELVKMPGRLEQFGTKCRRKTNKYSRKLKSAHPLFPGFFLGPHREPYCIRLSFSAQTQWAGSAGLLQSYTNCKERKGKNLSNCSTSGLNFSLIFWTNLMKPGYVMILSTFAQIIELFPVTFQLLIIRRKVINISCSNISILMSIWRHL